MFLLVGNSDSPFLVKQSQQGCGSSCYTLFAVIPSSLKFLTPYACQLASCSMGISCCGSCLLSLCPYVPCVHLFHNSLLLFSLLSSLLPLGLYSPPFYSGCFLIEPWDSLSDCAPWDSLSGFSGSPIGQVHSGVASLVL